MVNRISTSIKLACTPTSGTTYHQHDIAMGALACMFFQSPSLLEFQRQLDDLQQKNNLFTLFNMTNIPEDSQLRERLDNMDSEIYRAIFNNLFEQMRRDKALEQYHHISLHQNVNDSSISVLTNFRPLNFAFLFKRYHLILIKIVTKYWCV